MIPVDQEARSMNYDRSIVPLRPDHREREHIERRSWSRALAASALSSTQRGTAEKILRRTWPGDGRADVILKTAMSPTSTTDFPAADVVGAFKSLAPGSAAWKLFGREAALKLDLSGLHQSTFRISRACRRSRYSSPRARRWRGSRVAPHHRQAASESHRTGPAAARG
jgi:hypothetical protein